MFLTDVKETIEATQSPLKREAMAACVQQADDLAVSAKIVHDSHLANIIFSDEPEGGFVSTDPDENYLRRFTYRIGGFINQCEKTGEWPSLTSLAYLAIEHLGLEMDTAEARAALTTATLGEIYSNQAYHGNPHYRKVSIATMRQIYNHNQIYQDTEWVLGPRDISLMMVAAHIHDFKHDGQPNGNIASRLEKQSFEAAKPFLVSAGVDEDFLADLQTMIICTDVNPVGKPEAPVNQMKAAYEYYFEGKGERPVLQDNLKRLHDNPRLCLLAALFQEADLIPSVAFGYDRSVKENQLVALETGGVSGPSSMLFFLNKIFEGFKTRAGLKNDLDFLIAKHLFDADLQAGIVDYNAVGKSGQPITRPYPGLKHDKK